MSRRTGELLFDKIRTAAPPSGAPSAESPSSPGWQSGTGPESVREPAPSRLTVPLTTATRTLAPVAARTSSGVASHPPLEGDPVVSFDAGRMNLSLTSTASGIAAFILVLLLGGAFMVGRTVGVKSGREIGFKQGRDSFSSDAMDEIEQARTKPPKQDIVSNLLTGKPVEENPIGETTEAKQALPSAAEANAAKLPGSSDVAWIEGHNYIVVQEFEPNALADAQAARDFLLESKIPTVVVSVKGGRYRLLTVEGFNFKEPAQRQRADLLKKRIGEVGAKFFAAGGRYRLEGYYAAYKSGGW
ncbi:MAG: hypothetical protein IT449_19170 [Phycisphaerales bacterium]|nr:hypothetical protein [Phycisphaerales bacterium]